MITETFDSGLLGESILTTVSDAFTRLIDTDQQVCLVCLSLFVCLSVYLHVFVHQFVSTYLWMFDMVKVIFSVSAVKLKKQTSCEKSSKTAGLIQHGSMSFLALYHKTVNWKAFIRVHTH